MVTTKWCVKGTWPVIRKESHLSLPGFTYRAFTTVLRYAAGSRDWEAELPTDTYFISLCSDGHSKFSQIKNLFSKLLFEPFVGYLGFLEPYAKWTPIYACFIGINPFVLWGCYMNVHTFPFGWCWNSVVEELYKPLPSTMQPSFSMNWTLVLFVPSY